MNATINAELKRPGFLAAVILMTFLACLSSAEESEQPVRDKAAVLREEGNNWIQVGVTQLNRGFYEQAEKSLTAAEEFREYLTQAEVRRMEESIAKARQGGAERKAVMEYLSQARELLSQGRPVEARAQYEKVRNSPYLNEMELKQIAGELRTVDEAFDKRRMEITGVYNRSVEFYRAGELENARLGFSEVARSGILVAPRGQTAEDYLLQIDNILTEQLRIPGGARIEKEQGVIKQTAAGIPETNQQIPQAEENEPADGSKLQEEIKEVEAAAETAPKEKSQEEISVKHREKLIIAYTNAVVSDAEKKVEDLTGRKEFDKALAAVRAAAEIVSQNREIIGDEEFGEYAFRLKKLTDTIIEGSK